MSLPQHIVYGFGGTVYIDLLDRPSAVNVAIKSGDGTTMLATSVATVSVVSTTINAAANRGAWNVAVVNAANISGGAKLWLGLSDDPEEVLVRSTSANYVQLRRPLVYDHKNASTLKGTRASYACNATDAATLFWDGRAEWTVDGTLHDVTAVECTKYPMKRNATLQDVLDEEPRFNALKDPELDVERMLDLAHQDVLGRLAASSPDQRARVFTGSREFNQATVFAFFERFYRRQRGDDAAKLRTAYEEKLTSEITRMVQVVPRDADQDGAVEVGEKFSARSIRLYR